MCKWRSSYSATVALWHTPARFVAPSGAPPKVAMMQLAWRHRPIRHTPHTGRGPTLTPTEGRNGAARMTPPHYFGTPSQVPWLPSGAP
eukprot:5430598-Pyramimonas_sp.AAC.1